MALLLGFFGPKPFFSQQLNSSRWPLYCDHSVTSADIRPSVGREHQKRRYASLGEPSKCVLILSTIVLGMSTQTVWRTFCSDARGAPFWPCSMATPVNPSTRAKSHAK